MRILKTLACLALIAAVAPATSTLGQEKPQSPAPGAVPAMPPLPQPGPEHAVLKQDEGVWDATVEMLMGPGAPPMVSKGVETNVIGCGGLCLISDFKGDMMGMTFSGHSITAYDSGKKKYVGMWVDSMSSGASLNEATFDAATKTMTGTMEGPDMSGHVAKLKTVGVWKDADTRVWTMYSRVVDGKEAEGLRITYKRRK